MMLSEAEHPEWHIAVLIPARNEEELLPRCLRSVVIACQELPRGTTSDIVVVSDRSSDSTLSIAKTMLAGNGAALESMAGNVGVARELATQQALIRFRQFWHGDLSRCWLVNTDADCEVPHTWLLHQLGIAQRGYHAVTGIVDVDSFAEHLPVVESHFRTTYLIHADGSHPHVHGANLGVRADTYLLAGGWNPLHTAEDHDLWNRLKACGVPHLTDAHCRVVTSGRRTGRAPLGFAGALAAHNTTLEHAVA